METKLLLVLLLLGPGADAGAHDGRGGGQQDFMLLAGPLGERPAVGPLLSSGGVQQDVPLCEKSSPAEWTPHFEYLQSRGVTHFKVPLSWSLLLPTGDPERPLRRTVACYRALLGQLSKAHLKPLVVLHGAGVPEPVGVAPGGWYTHRVVSAFQSYAEFAFAAFGDLVDTWITFSDVHALLEGGVSPAQRTTMLENMLLAHRTTYRIYHGRVSLICLCGAHYKPYTHTEWTCTLRCCPAATHSLNAETTLEQHAGGDKGPLLIYQLDVEGCASERGDEFEPLISILNALKRTELQVLGCDIVDLFDQLTADTAPKSGQAFANQTGDLACDSYNKVDYDAYLLRGLLVTTYQFSISWARVFPSGRRGSLSEKGARYGDRVKTWNTFSSPWVISIAGYGTGEHPPGITDPIISSYQVTHNMLKSHAEAWHVYNDKYRQQQGGKVGIALNSDWAEPQDPSRPQDISAAERYLQFMLGWFAHPIFVDGDYPPSLKSQVEQKRQECPQAEPAQLPTFNEIEKKRIRGTADFFGLNHYTSRLVNDTFGGCVPGPRGVGDFQEHIDPAWPLTASEWIRSVPWGLRRLLSFIAAEYTSITKVPIYITGNGMPTQFGGDVFNDTERILFLKSYINEALKAVRLDGVDVRGFTVQSLMDGFEGPQGYSERFGLHYVNFEDPNRPRTPKASAYFYSKVIENNGFVGLREKMVLPKHVPQPRTTKLVRLPPSEVPSKSKVVWEKFSHQSNFERKLYHYGTFPEGFEWGVSSSAYQVEGGWNADGKGASVWDTFTHKPGSIVNNANGDVACDSYHRADEDLYMLRALRVKSYRFSLSWPRIFPDGSRASLNQQGVNYYNKLINGLVASNITPMVTLHHWDLPQALQDIGGWENVSMINYFDEFCDFCFATFGDRVKFWMTFNEPYVIAWVAHGQGLLPPGIKNPGYAPYQVAHNLIKAHAKVYHIYDERYRKTQGGLVSISLNADWVEPKDVDVFREVAAADRALQFRLGWFAHPIFKNGDYPDAMKWMVGNKSELQGLPASRLPAFTDEEKEYIQGTADVFCINTYTSEIVHHVTSLLSPPSYDYDQDVREAEMDDSPATAMKGLRVVPWGLRRLLNWIKEEYGNPEIYITENGMSTDSKTTVDDTDRVFFYKTYIDEALKAHNLDGVKLKGYIAWSLLDSFEWLNGYSIGFGLHHVDFNHPERPRTPKRSAHYYYDIMRNNGFPLPDEEKLLYARFDKGFAWSTSTASYQRFLFLLLTVYAHCGHCEHRVGDLTDILLIVSPPKKIEGGWRAHGKGLSIWDKFAHTPLKVGNDDNGDVACDSYNKIREDVAALRTLGVTHYRFSVSWPRVLPDGTTGKVNEAGLDYYRSLVDALLAANIQPQVTLYHWDLPLALQDQGGWENETIVQHFKEYADFIFSRLGDKVKFWITINEPYNVAQIGHGYGTAAPGISFRPGTLPYIVGHHLLKAHAEAWHVYNDKYRSKQGGVISITINSDWAEPRNPYKQEDIDAARRFLQFYIGWFAHPVFNGDYSDVMKTVVRERSLAAGLPRSRLPEFSADEVQRIRGTYDYFGFNHYTTVLTYKLDYKNLQHYDADRGVATVTDPSWLDSGSFWLKVTPHGFRKILNFIKEEYGDPPVYITENGVSERGPVHLNDVRRIHYYRNYLNQALKGAAWPLRQVDGFGKMVTLSVPVSAKVLDSVDIRGYTAWTLMDNLEWATGFAERFGLFYVNRSDPTLPRVPKESAAYYATVIACNGFPDPALGPDPCLTPEPEETSTPPTTSPAPVQGVKFMGGEMSPPDAEVALYILFSLSLVGAVLLVLMSYRYWRGTNRRKWVRAED
ncbi:lactase-phlorizin hydrolase-like [Scleropages formosus]|uniref:beta-glucosidase n=1 Tax=Scleropages formosus TaxID=113540 RepID=A0A0P7TWK4_SCLFO|nr:lactase-phlorizin hydrolase-like [Scleropages formosus]